MPFEDPGSDRAIVDTASGPTKGHVLMAAPCERGDVLGYSTGWKPAFAKTGEVIQGRVVALAAGRFDAEKEIADVVPVAPDPAIDGYLGATPGDPVYVAEATGHNGRVTQTIPTDTGDATTVIGIALTATRILFLLNSRVDSIA